MLPLPVGCLPKEFLNSSKPLRMPPTRWTSDVIADARSDDMGLAGRPIRKAEPFGAVCGVMSVVLVVFVTRDGERRLTTPSSATGVAGAGRAWRVERRRRKHGP